MAELGQFAALIATRAYNREQLEALQHNARTTVTWLEQFQQDFMRSDERAIDFIGIHSSTYIAINFIQEIIAACYELLHDPEAGV